MPARLTAKARAARDRLREAQLEIAADVAERKLRKLKESFDFVSPDWAGLYGEILRQQTEPGWMPIGLGVTAHRQGANFPFFQNEQQHSIIRDVSRVAAGTSNHAHGLLRGLTAFTVGTGFQFKVNAKKGLDETGQAAARAANLRVTAFLDAWAKRVRWGERQQELYRRTQRDGDGLLVLFEGDGFLDLRFRWPEQLRQPTGTDPREWSFGIKTDPDDLETRYAYWFADLTNLALGEEIDAADVIHLVDRETDSGVKRGLPLFSFDCREALDTAARLTRNLGEGSAVRAAIAYLRKHAQAGPAEVQAFISANETYREPVPLTDKMRSLTKLDPGMVLDTPEGMDHDPPPASSETAAASGVVDLLVRAACSRVNAPEWLASSNAANMGAFTSSLVAESPFVKGILGDQEWLRVRFMTVIERALEVGRKAGEVREEDLRLVDVDLVPPSPEVRNKIEESQRAAIEIPLGVDSRQNYASSQGRDFDRIDSDNRAYQDEHGSAGAELPLSGVTGDDPRPGG